MNHFSLLLAASSALAGSAGPNVRVIGQERSPDGPDATDDDTQPSTHPDPAPAPLADITPAERARVRKLTSERESLWQTMEMLGFQDDGFYRRHDILTRHGHRKAERAAPSPGPRVMPPKKEHPLSGVRTEAAPKGPGKRTRAQRRADNAHKLTAEKRGGNQPPASPASPVNPRALLTFKAVKPMPSDTSTGPFRSNGAFMGGGSYALRAVIKAVEAAGHKLTGLHAEPGNENAVFKVFYGLGVASISSNPHDFTVNLHHEMMGKRYEVHVCDTTEQILAVLSSVDEHVGLRLRNHGMS